jgi:hypothetical protein
MLSDATLSRSRAIFVFCDVFTALGAGSFAIYLFSSISTTDHSRTLSDLTVRLICHVENFNADWGPYVEFLIFYAMMNAFARAVLFVINSMQNARLRNGLSE